MSWKNPGRSFKMATSYCSQFLVQAGSDSYFFDNTRRSHVATTWVKIGQRFGVILSEFIILCQQAKTKYIIQAYNLQH